MTAPTQEERLGKVEDAIVQINHFTETMESLNLSDWKLSVAIWQARLEAKFDTTNMWLKLLVAGAWISPIVAIVILWNLIK